MIDLINALKAAKGPSSELDARIYCAVNGLEFVSVGEKGSIHFKPDAAGTQTMVTPHPYTSSLDTAMELVPAGKFWIIGSGKTRADEPLGSAEIFQPKIAKDYFTIADAEHESPIIALCIAALTARIAIK